MKEEEKNYQYWENEFSPHQNYMIADGNNEYAQIRTKIGEYVKDGDSVLDIGCACGNNLEWWEKLGKQFTYKGVDYAENFTKANRDRRPEIEWETMDARHLEAPDASFNMVVLYDVLDNLEGWEMALNEALRVAKDTVIITMWMDNKMPEKKPYLESLGYHVKEFDIENKGCHFHKFLVIEKNILICDWDDFGIDMIISDQCQTKDCRKELEELKKVNPNFKATLFAVPATITDELYSWVHKNQDWIELAQHGYTHLSNYECNEMTKEECLGILRDRFKGFKCPGWQISDGCYEALKEKGMWVADQPYNKDRRPEGLRIYEVGEQSIHGHCWNCCGNGIEETLEELKEKIKDETKFRFISEVV